MKRKLTEANYNLSISDLNTTDGDALSQILAMASQADDDQSGVDLGAEPMATDPYADEFENGLDDMCMPVDEPFDVPAEPAIEEPMGDEFGGELEPEIEPELPTEETEELPFDIADYSEYGIDENDFNEEEPYTDRLAQDDTILINEAEGQTGYAIMVDDKEYGFLPTENEYTDEEIKNEFLKQYISEKGEEFPYAEEIVIVRKDSVDEDLLLSKDEADPTNVAKMNEGMDEDEYRNSDEFLASFEHMYETLLNGNIDLYKEKLNKLSPKQLISYIAWADNMGIDKADLRLEYIKEDDNGAVEFEDSGDLELVEGCKKSLKEEYGDYKGNPTIEHIGSLIEDGHTSGIEPSWELKVSLDNAEWDNLTYDMKEYLLRDIAYPVKDGHLYYDGLDIIIYPEGSDLSDEDILSMGAWTMEEIKKARQEKNGELETWISYDIEIDQNDLEGYGDDEEEYEDDEDELEEQIKEALRNAGVEKLDEAIFAPKVKEPAKKKANQARYQEVDIKADSKAGTVGFQDNANPSQPTRSNQNKPAKIVETAQRLLAKVATDKKEKLQTRFVYKLMNEGISYTRAKEIISKL